MNPPSEDAAFEYLCYYQPAHARRLMKAFEEAGIPFDAQFFDGIRSIHPVNGAHGGYFGSGAQILLSIDPARRPDVQQIHTDLLEDCVPNFKSRFFDENPSVTPGTQAASSEKSPP